MVCCVCLSVTHIRHTHTNEIRIHLEYHPNRNEQTHTRVCAYDSCVAQTVKRAAMRKAARLQCRPRMRAYNTINARVRSRAHKSVCISFSNICSPSAYAARTTTSLVCLSPKALARVVLHSTMYYTAVCWVMCEFSVHTEGWPTNSRLSVQCSDSLTFTF